MSTAIDEITADVDPENEVRKLQDLVKHLEHQNKILRSKTEPLISDRDGDGTFAQPKAEQEQKTDTSKNVNSKVESLVLHDDIVRTKEYQYSNKKETRSLNDIDDIDLDGTLKDESEASW